MAGRGADIRVQMLTTGEVHKLSVGLHTPLGIFKRQVRVCLCQPAPPWDSAADSRPASAFSLFQLESMTRIQVSSTRHATQAPPLGS